MVDLKSDKILVTGAHGFLGRFVVDELLSRGVPKENISTPEKEKFDLTKLEDAKGAVYGNDIIIHLAAKLGGIKLYVDEPAEILRENVLIDAQVMEAARLSGVKKLVAIGSSSSYPENAPMPLAEKDFWNGYPDKDIAPYAVAKRMLLVQSKAYRQEYGLNSIYLILANIYGPRFDSHTGVIPSLIRRCFEAEKNNSDSLEVWGSGNACREFLYVGDAAKGIVTALQKYDKEEPINIGTGNEVSIKKTAELIKDAVGFSGDLVWDSSKPEGSLHRYMSVSLAKEEFGFEAETDFEDGIKRSVDWFRENS